jgi:hypothetical protein
MTVYVSYGRVWAPVFVAGLLCAVVVLPTATARRRAGRLVADAKCLLPAHSVRLAITVDQAPGRRRSVSDRVAFDVPPLPPDWAVWLSRVLGVCPPAIQIV